MPIYCFYYDDGKMEFLMEIEADLKTVEKLLDEYRETDPEYYNNLDWLTFLHKRGIKARFLEPDFQRISKPKINLYIQIITIIIR